MKFIKTSTKNKQHKEEIEIKDLDCLLQFIKEQKEEVIIGIPTSGIPYIEIYNDWREETTCLQLIQSDS